MSEQDNVFPSADATSGLIPGLASPCRLPLSHVSPFPKKAKPEWPS